MFVSLHLSPLSRGPVDDLDVIDELVEHVVLADRAGIASVSLTEHHLAGFNTYCDPLSFAMHLAGKVEQTYLALHVVQTPLQHPLRLVEQCNLLDLVTRGRAMIALAPGSVRQIELDAFGVALEARSDMTSQGLDSMLKAWDWERAGGGSVDISNDYYRGVIAGRVSPSSFRQPHPLIGRASGTPATIVDTARRGLPIILGDPDADAVSLYRDTLASSGHSAEVMSECDDWLGFVDMVSLAPSEREADAILRDFAEGGGAGPVVTSADEGSATWVAEWRSRLEARKNWSAPVTPAMLVERLLANQQLGVNHVRVTLAQVPGQRQRNLDTLHLFLEEVLPHLTPERLRDPAVTVLTEAQSHDRVLSA